MQSDVNFPLVPCKPATLIIQPKFNQCKRFVLHPHFPFIYLTISILGSSIIFGLSLKYTLRFVPSTMLVYSFIAGEKIQMLQTPMHWIYAAQLALLPTVLSLFFMTISINLIGSTPAAIMGALEPVTAVIIGVCIFGESFSLQLAIGILAILAGVTIIIARKK